MGSKRKDKNINLRTLNSSISNENNNGTKGNILITLAAIGLFIFLAANSNFFVKLYKSFSNLLANDRISRIPTPTPELLISCNVGKFSFDLPRIRCNSLQGYIEAEKKIDVAIVKQLIDGLNSQIQKLNTPNNNANQSDFKGQLENVLDGCGGNVSEVHGCKLDTLTTLLNFYDEERKRNHDILMKLYERLDKYENYLLKIQLGGVSSGACMNHDGVDCSTSRGNIGQVICADGWNQSQVYYFNIKECVEHTESTLSH